MRNKHLRMLWGILSYPFKMRYSYKGLAVIARERAELKAYERRMHMRSLCGR